MFILTALSVLICGAGSIILQRRSLSFSPLPYFIFFSMIFALSTAFAANANEAVDAEHLWLIIIYFFSILIYSIVFFDHNRSIATASSWRNMPWISASDEPVGKIACLFLVSAAVSYLYYDVLVGYNLFIEMIRGSNIDYTTKRLEAYANNAGYAGIVNQFKNTILPVTYFSLIFAIYRRGHRRLAALLTTAIAPFFLWSILGTGQRTFFFFSIAGLMFYLNLAARLRVRHVLIAAAIFIPMFALQSQALGRTVSIGLSDTISQLGWRLFGSNQMATLVGFRYVYMMPVQYGAEWAKVLVGFIPGVQGSDLSNQVHYVLFRSMRGTAPVSLWVSIYHNFGMAGVIPAMIIFMKLIEKLGHVILRIPKSELGTCAWGFFIFYVSIIPISNPFQIINNGLPALLLIMLLFWSDLRRLMSHIVYRHHITNHQHRDSHSGGDQVR